MSRGPYQNARQKQIRLEWLQENGPCIDCQSWENLEIDHDDATTKSLDTGRLWCLSPLNPKRIEELQKCVVRCHNCHVKKTTINKEYSHGENQGKGKKYSNEFVLEVLQICDNRKTETLVSIARQLNIPPNTLYSWTSGRNRKYARET